MRAVKPREISKRWMEEEEEEERTKKDRRERGKHGGRRSFLPSSDDGLIDGT